MTPGPFRIAVLAPLVAAVLVFPRSLPAADELLPKVVEYNRDLRPILAENCFLCHGPDANHRKAQLRLDVEEVAIARRGDTRAIVPGHPERSEAFRRITTDAKAERMPPAKTGRRLTKRQVAVLQRWIEQGAKYQKHWSFLPPRRPDLPAIADRDWPRNGIDAFILARLEREKLRPAPEADRVTLLRRVSLDLVGLPPTPAEVDAFLGDSSPDAYEKVVDRLLASPRWGEQMAARWLDAARYADTNGYQSDGERFMWRWRDWVIEAFNANMPFDQFTIEQLAGDLLPNPTLSQRIATGFNRNHRGNGEGGVIPEEYAVEYVVDRVDTTATVWLGLTLGCARCHDHKYDPIRQKEFYQLFAFFNNVPERGKAIKYGNSPPLIKAPTPEQERHLADLTRRLADAEQLWLQKQPALDKAQSGWEKSHPSLPPTPWAPQGDIVTHFPLDGSQTKGTFRDGDPQRSSGHQGPATAFDGRCFLDAGDVGHFGFYDRFSLAAWVRPEGSRGGVILSRMTDAEQADGYSLHVVDGHLQVNLVKRWLDDAIRVQTEERLQSGRWQHVLATYDGSRVAAGVRVYIDGRPAKLQVLLDDLNQSFETKQPLRIGAGAGPGGRFHGAIQDVRLWHEVVAGETVAIAATPEPIDALHAIPPDRRTPGQAAKLRAWFLEVHAPQEFQAAARAVDELRRQRQALQESIPTTMVMQELPRPRDTFVLKRGEYDKRGEKVSPGLPGSLGTMPPDGPGNRLALARWLVSADNPLTARVTVNRWWQGYFGTGLVKTVEDFGSQGEWPSNPELLDWLATEFIRTRWDVKAMQRLIVTSAAYRQSSRVTPELLAADPDNRLLARGPRVRLPAETIRDQALFASGLLVEHVGGPSVKPYQPPGLWKELADTDYVADHGEGLYRRSLYTFWKRTVAPPGMTTFDAPLRETCVVRQTRTNTPLQALALLNDIPYVEAARFLAQRAMKEGGKTPSERLAWAFRLATGRVPKSVELQVLVEGWQAHQERYRTDRAAAVRLLAIGEKPADSCLDAAELAAYTGVCSLILNLDEVVNKE
jgi:hypothetical protein